MNPRILWPLTVGAACYPDISDTLDPGPPGPGPGLAVQATDDGGHAVVIDATSYDDWVHVDLDALQLTDEAGGWDLAARRFEIKLNGGVSGDGGVQAANDEQAFELVVTAPQAGWVTDEADADGDEVPEYALLEWYVYDYATHELTPAELTWVIRTTDQRVFKLAFDGYYDDSGTPARIALRVAELDR